jgi:hypothetical protein
VTRLLILTNSADGTCDALVRLLNCRNIPLFRWNVDLWRDYQIRTTSERIEISDPTGRHIDLGDPEVVLLWRKPFADLMEFDGLPIAPEDQEAALGQIAQWLRAVVARMMLERRVRLVEPYADQRLPKLFQIQEARRFFLVPKSLFSTVQGPESFGPMMIVKPLGDSKVGVENIFYTKYIDGRELFRPYPWFVQEALVGGHDITCVYINGRSHFFECDFTRDENAIDWRTEINTPDQSAWHRLRGARADEWSNSVKAYMKHSRLHYGRLDFIRRDEELFFLECNTNGQFGWLDEDPLCLHTAFLDAALDPNTVIVGT